MKNLRPPFCPLLQVRMASIQLKHALCMYFMLTFVKTQITTPQAATTTTTPGSTYFTKQSSFYSAQNKWLVAVVVDLDPYLDGLRNLSLAINAAEISIDGFIKTHLLDPVMPPHAPTGTYTMHTVYRRLMVNQRSVIQHLKGDLATCATELNDMVRIHNETYATHGRNKRSWLPFLGDILNTITGVPSQSQMDEIRKQIVELSSSELDLAHIVEDSISLINISRLEIKRNRQTINVLVDVTDALQNELNNVTHQLHGLAHFQRFTLHHIQLENYILSLTDMITNFKFDVTNLKLSLSNMFMRKLTPEIISPSDLTQVLLNIRNTLPNVVSLPFDVDSKLMSYYQTLTCEVTHHSKGFVFIINIPLLDVTSQFELYKVISIPMPFKSSNLSAKFDLSSQGLAISTDMSKAIFMNDANVMTCARHSVNFCRLSSPIHYINRLKDNCMLALFLKQTTIHDICKVKLSIMTDTTSKGFYLNNGIWAISLHKPSVIVIICPNRRNNAVKLLPPLSFIHLELGCYANGEDFMLPPYFHKESKFTIPTSELYIPEELHIWNPVITEVEHSLKHFPQKLPELLKGNTKMNSLKMDIQAHRSMLAQRQWKTHISNNKYIYIAVALVLLLIVFLNVLVYCKYKSSIKKRLHNFRKTFRKQPTPIDTDNDIELQEFPRPTPYSIYPVLDLRSEAQQI